MTTEPEVLGIPVRMEDRSIWGWLRRKLGAPEPIAHSRGIWPWKAIYVGPDFFRLPIRIQGAILYHEAGHCKLFHVEQRLLWLLLCLPVLPLVKGRYFEYVKRHELEADRFAAERGFALGLIELFQHQRAAGHSGGPVHPDLEVRLSALCQLLSFKEIRNAVA